MGSEMAVRKMEDKLKIRLSGIIGVFLTSYSVFNRVTFVNDPKV